MNHDTRYKPDSQRAVDLIADAGGTIIGRTRLQKLAYLLEATGLGEGFEFQYRHYGPYSERLTVATQSAMVLGLVEEEEKAASWGGFYSIFRLRRPEPDPKRPASPRSEVAKIAAETDSVVLELAATAAFLYGQGYTDAWHETARRKPEKAKDGRLEQAKVFYRSLAEIHTPKRLPDIA
jgi:uncharacterized protein